METNFWENMDIWVYLSSVTQLKRTFASNETMDLDTGVETGLNNDLCGDRYVLIEFGSNGKGFFELMNITITFMLNGFFPEIWVGNSEDVGGGYLIQRRCHY